MARRRKIVLTQDRFTAIVNAFDVWARGRIAEAGHFTVMAALDMIGTHPVVGSPKGCVETHRPIFKKVLEALPHFGSLGPKSGYGLLGRTTRPHTLATLMPLASAVANANQDYVPPQGRRTDRGETRINQGQLVKIEGAAATFAEMVTTELGLPPSREALDLVGPGYFLWDAAAGNGSGDWEACAAIAAYSDRTAQAKHAAEGNDPAMWQSGLNADRRKKHVQGVRLLLDLAAAHRWLERGPTPPPLPTIHAPEWTPVIKEWVGMLVADPEWLARYPGGSVATTRVRLIALYATRKAWRTPVEVQWDQVHRDIEAAVEAGAHPNALAPASMAYNRLVALGAIQGPRWTPHQDPVMVLVKHDLIKRAASNLDVSGLRLSNGIYPTALCEGLFGLQAYLQWLTFSPKDLATSGLPPRAYVNPTPQQQFQMAKSPRLFQIKPTTLLARLQAVLYHAGYLARHQGVDFTTAGLDVLCNPALIDEHVAVRAKDGEGDSHMSRLVQDLGMIASPFLEARALQASEAARTAGDLSKATELAAKAHELAGWGHQLKLKQVGLGRRRNSGTSWDQDREEYTRQKAVAIWQAFTIDDRSGWYKLRLLRDELVLEVERQAWLCTGGKKGGGRISIERQLELIRQDTAALQAHRAHLQAGVEQTASTTPPTHSFRMTINWAIAVKYAVLLTLIQRIPLRPTNVVNLSMREWRNTATSPNAQPWEGGIHLEISASKMKAPRGFSAAYLLNKDRDNEDVMASARVDLLELYFTAGGARDEILRLPRGFKGVIRKGGAPVEFQAGDVVPSPYVFPTAARRSASRGVTQSERIAAGLSWTHGAYEHAFATLLTRHAALLRIDVDTLRQIHGGLGPQLIRHLFGSHHCDKERYADAVGLAQASKMLHHKDTDTTESFYCGVTAREVSVGRIRPSETTPETPTLDYAAQMDIAIRRFELGSLTQAEFLSVKASLAARYRIHEEVTPAA